MEDSRDTHVVEIPVEGENQLSAAAAVAMQHHPLKEISESPGHLLLLKLWQREENLSGQRIGAKETKLQSIKREAFQLCCLFFAFHGLFLTLLFTFSVQGTSKVCRDWWVPSFLSLASSVVLICAVQTKICGYWKVSRELQKERGEGRALTRFIQELRMKGSIFDLSKEPQTGKRMKSSSVEIKWRSLRWCWRNLATICLLCFTGAAFPACKFVLCG